MNDQDFRTKLNSSTSWGAQGITIVAPSSGLPEARAKLVRDAAAKLGVIFPPDALDPDAMPYTANTDDKRLAFLTQALQDPETLILWAMSGGYGASRLLEGLAKVPRPWIPRLIVGYSDITFLHLYAQSLGWRSVHGATFWELNNPTKDPENFRMLANILGKHSAILRYEGLIPVNDAARQSTSIYASVTGGNLTCLTAAIGTPFPPQTEGKFLLLEDVDEQGYRIDRMLTQLRLAGHLDNVAAVILGSFTRCGPDAEYALERFASTFAKPVFRTDLFGHGPKNYPIVFNTHADIRNNKDGTFTLTVSPVQGP